MVNNKKKISARIINAFKEKALLKDRKIKRIKKKIYVAMVFALLSVIIITFLSDFFIKFTISE